MAKDNLVEFSRSKDVLYAIDAKAGNGRLLSPIQGNLTLLDQDPTASTFEEKQGYIVLSGVDVENGYFTAQGTTYDKVNTPVDLRGRSTSFTLVCKGVLRGEYGVSYGMLYCQGTTTIGTYAMAILWYNCGNDQIYYGNAMLYEDGTTNRCDSAIYTATQYLNKEHFFVHVVDFENRRLYLYIDGELVKAGTISTSAISVALNSVSATVDENEYLNLFRGSEVAGSKYGDMSSSSVSYFAFVDKAMSAEEIKALGGA